MFSLFNQQTNAPLKTIAKTLLLPSPLETDVEGRAAERNKAILRKYERRVNRYNTVTDVVVVTTAVDFVAAAALGSTNTNDGDRGAGHAAIEQSNQPSEPPNIEDLVHIAGELTNDDSEGAQEGRNGGSQFSGLMIPVSFRVDQQREADLRSEYHHSTAQYQSRKRHLRHRHEEGRGRRSQEEVEPGVQ